MKGYVLLADNSEKMKGLLRQRRIDWVKEVLAQDPRTTIEESLEKLTTRIPKLEEKEINYAREFLEEIDAYRVKKALEPQELIEELAQNNSDTIEATIRYARANIGSYMTRRLDDTRKAHDMRLIGMFDAIMQADSYEDMIKDIKTQKKETLTEEFCILVYDNKGAARTLGEAMANTFKDRKLQLLKTYTYDAHSIDHLLTYIRGEQ